MQIIHFNPNDSGLRFLQGSRMYFKESFNDQGQSIYRALPDANDFVGLLNSRISYPDVVLITAHGTDDAILGVRQGKLIKAMRLHQTRLFKNNFVLAVSCLTAKEFGKKAIEEAAQVYIGFDDYIQSDFKFGSSLNQKFNDILEKIFKKIYQLSLNRAFSSFIKKSLTARELTMLIELNFKKLVRELQRMDIKNIRTVYSVQLTEKLEDELRAVIKLQFIAKYNTLQKKISLLGDPYYVPWYYINYLNKEELQVLLEKINNMDEKNNYYKYFVELLVYMKLNDQVGYLGTYEKFEKELCREDLVFEVPFNLPKDIA
ncbi:hypothetical protein [Brevibacillus dissolubilis]|uniref:hypothetical protein n=1 Tax=Brevibacillus dissolubilis TaxID=1844116 RepID=UPI0011167FCE|nr:hypothetical protein [Brevibacillus dissolubilis]